ncbi:lactaldehyde reductase [Bacteroides sp. 51]|uniref:lactaldehyde reductase n=1 Tax=Bacteroides sp. 51 TaxID=2302938 RepID=UPI0013D5C218|nr:lactaldehyde reductase [Bacteroides sp. 51]NDV81392.1 lactaldehyde reductase [Bacteroides sp. 51]
MINRFILNEVSYFGPGAREVLPQEITRLGLSKAFVATDKDLIKFGVADKVLDVLKKAGIPYEVFSEIKPNPTVSNVKAGVKAFADSKADFILAIGGGSSIDTAKAIGIITNNPEFSDVVSLEGVAPTKKKSVPIIALPTTAGTAAEVTINYVITDEVNEKKMVCVDPNDIPAIAIVDAELMYTLPRSLTASTGLDALTHAIEGLITKGAWEMSDMFEIKAIEMIARYLETATNEPDNAEARNGMAVAQYIAGMAFSNVGLGVVHGMAHPLGAIFDIPHGVANALLLPTIMEFNAPAALDKYVLIAKAMDVYSTGMTKEEAADAAVKAVRELSIRLGIPQHLSELGIKESDLEKLAESAAADVCTPGNPREVNKEIILDLYKKVL